MDNVFTVTQLVEAAERDVRARSTSVQEKTAAADPSQEFSIDLLSTESVMAMAKVARALAERMKIAEDAMEGASGINTGAVGAGKEDSLTPSAESPEQFVVAPKGTPNISPSKNPFSIPSVTDEKQPDSMTPGVSTPEQHISPEKVGGLDPIRSLHSLYVRAARSLAKMAQPGGYAQPITETGPMAGPGKPEASPTAPGTSSGDKPPTSVEAVQALTRQDADAKALEDAAQQTDLPATAAKETTEGVLDEVLKAASMDQVKAAAFRQWYATLPPDSRIANLIRDKIASMGKESQSFHRAPLKSETSATPDAAGSNDPGLRRRRLREGEITMGGASEPVPVAAAEGANTGGGA